LYDGSIFFCSFIGDLLLLLLLHVSSKRALHAGILGGHLRSVYDPMTMTWYIRLFEI